MRRNWNVAFDIAGTDDLNPDRGAALGISRLADALNFFRATVNKYAREGRTGTVWLVEQPTQKTIITQTLA